MTRLGWTVAVTLVIGGMLLPRPGSRLIWNASASVPIGLYAVRPVGELYAGELVLVRPPDVLAAFLQERGYLALGVPLLKHVLALSGQSVCRIGRTITVDERAMGNALDHDHLGRELPTWTGCRIVADGEVFLMNPASASSFDGRYFGLLPGSTIAGRLVPLWIERD
jgi:conjugative transfer signal peptidase TraF